LVKLYVAGGKGLVYPFTTLLECRCGVSGNDVLMFKTYFLSVNISSGISEF